MLYSRNDNQLGVGEFASLVARATNGQRFSDAEALKLFELDNLELLQQIGFASRSSRHGNRAYYVINRHINYSNICILDCDFCAFGKRKRDADAYELTIQEMVERARQALAMGATEIHMVGGLHPTWKFEVYLELLRALRQLSPDLALKAFTAIEILHFQWVSKLSLESVLGALQEAGLNCLTGGGAEIFEPTIRNQICRGKESGEEWLMVHRTAHKMGIRSTATMLFGHQETYQHRIDHLRALRELQDETGGFLAFLPLAFKPAHRLIHLTEPNAEETLKNIAVCRVYLDNFEHIKAYWISYGLELAKEALRYGADDLDGTIEEERIYHMAGAKTPIAQSALNLRTAIEESGFEPVLRDCFYRTVANVGG